MAVRAGLPANARRSTAEVAKATTAAGQSCCRDLDCLQHRSDFMAKRVTFTTTADISKDTKPSNSSERVAKTIHKIATVSTVAFSASAITATPGSAARVRRSMAPPHQYCLSYDAGGTARGLPTHARVGGTDVGQHG